MDKRLILYSLRGVLPIEYRYLPRFLLTDIGILKENIPDKSILDYRLKPLTVSQSRALDFLKRLHRSAYDFGEGRICHWVNNELVLSNVAILSSTVSITNKTTWYFSNCMENVIFEKTTDFIFIKTIGF